VALHTFNYSEFVLQFPAYATAPPESQLQAYFALATNFVNPNDNWCGGLNDGSLDYALNCLVAHYAYINDLISMGQNSVIVTSSTVDKVSVSLLAPPVKDFFQYWLATSPYGKQLLALLRVKAAGGWYVSKGLTERRAFRKVGGTFR
jgi:hypothetical protein